MTDIVERLRAVDHMMVEDCFLQSHLFAQAADEIERLREAANEIERLRAECQRLAGEVSRAHKDALAWMERAAAARREGIEAAAKVAEWAHMVEPDGGSPTDAEYEVARIAAQRIRALDTAREVMHRRVDALRDMEDGR